MQRFDPLQARISLSNVTITLNNKDYRWLPSNITTGRWAPDTTASAGYDPVQSQMVIYYGYEIPGSSTPQLLEMFTGLVEDDPQFDSKSGTASFTLVGLAEKKLKEADAQKVCTTLASQVTNPANGNGSNDTFSTQKKSLWQVSNVRFGVVVKTQGDNADYTLQDLNDPEVEAKIKATASSIPGAVAILWDGKQWHRDKTIKQLAELLCDEAGIASGDRTVEDAVFPGVDQSFVQDTEADFAASVLTNMDKASIPGRIKHKLFFARSSWADWTKSGAGTSNYIQHSSDPNNSLYQYNAIYVTGTDGISTNHFLRATLTPGAGATITKDFTSLSTSPVDDYVDAGTDGPYTLKLELIRTSDNSVRYTMTYGVSIDSSSRVRIRYSRQNFYGVGGGGGVGQHQVLIYDIASHSIAPTGRIVLPEIDTTVAPISLLALAKAITLNGGTATIYTKVTNTSGVGYDARVAVNASDVPQSALKRYWVIEIDTTPDAGKTGGPELDSITLNWRGSNLFIGSADFTGKSCIEAMQDLAELGGMEFGTKTGGVFYLRNKTVSGSADMVISQKNVVLEVLDFSMGYREVRNVGQVRYGQPSQSGYYYAEYSKVDAAEAEPTSERRFGRRPIRLEISNLIFSQGAQVASAIAQKLYQDNYLPKRRARVRCRIIPHLEMSDKVQLSYHDSPLIEKVIFGDPLQVRPAMGPTNTLARDILMKVVGKSDDLMKAETILDLEEVLS